jgi:DNA-binding MarR family transcriptional regulator
MREKQKALIGMQDFRKLPGHLIRRLHQVSASFFAEECAELEITPVQYAALFAIGESPGIDATRLSEQIFFDRSTLGSVLDRLERKKLVHRRSSHDDRRTKVLTLTPQGEEELRLAAPAVLRVQERLMSPFSATDRQRMQKLLQRLADLHKVHEIGTIGKR